MNTKTNSKSSVLSIDERRNDMKAQAHSKSSVQTKKSKFRFVLPFVALLLVAACVLLVWSFRVVSISGKGKSYVLEANQTQLGILIIEEDASATFQEKSHWIGPVISIQGELIIEKDVTITGPVVLFSNSLLLGEHATMNGSVCLLSGSLRLKPGASVLHNAILFAGDVYLEQDASILNDIILFVGDVELQEKASLRGDAVLFAGNMNIGEEATAHRRLIMFAGKVNMAPMSLLRDNAVLLAGDIHLYPGAQIRGNVIVTEGNATLDSRSTIDGKLYLNPEPMSGKGCLYQSSDAQITRGVIKPKNIELISGWQVGGWAFPLLFKLFLPLMFVFCLLLALVFYFGRRSMSPKPKAQYGQYADAKP